jgi:hypothetical protein
MLFSERIDALSMFKLSRQLLALPLQPLLSEDVVRARQMCSGEDERVSSLKVKRQSGRHESK